MPSKRSSVPSNRSSQIQHESESRPPPPARPNESCCESPDLHLPLYPPGIWPPKVDYLNRPIGSPYLTNAQQRWLHQKPPSVADHGDYAPAMPIIKLPQTRSEIDSRIKIKLISDEKHPAHGQRGLFAARGLGPGELIVPYIGYVHSSTASERTVEELQERLQSTDQGSVRTTEDAALVQGSTVSSGNNDMSQNLPFEIGTWDTSSYDLNLHRDLEEDIELAIDAAYMGNEARFCNDYRGVPASDVTDCPSKQWDRKAKRGAKTWSADGAASEGGIGDGAATAMAIPNAEFKDVWFEWLSEDDAGPAGDNTTTNGAEDGMKKLDIDEKDPKTKHMHRQRRKKKTGMRGVAIFVMPAGKSGKRKHGIQAGQEILVSYGKGFWSHRGV